jgi:hypothetical protein
VRNPMSTSRYSRFRRQHYAASNWNVALFIGEGRGWELPRPYSCLPDSVATRRSLINRIVTNMRDSTHQLHHWRDRQFKPDRLGVPSFV